MNSDRYIILGSLDSPNLTTSATTGAETRGWHGAIRRRMKREEKEMREPGETDSVASQCHEGL